MTGLFSIGRRNRVVGVSYEIDTAHTVYFDPDINKMMSSLSRALPNQPNLRLVDSSIDEQVLLLFAGSDDDPGLYYVFDRASKRLRTIFVARDQLEGVKLAKVRPVSYPATDGTMIPGYLTLPPGREDSKALPAIRIASRWALQPETIGASTGYRSISPHGGSPSCSPTSGDQLVTETRGCAERGSRRGELPSAMSSMLDIGLWRRVSLTRPSYLS